MSACVSRMCGRTRHARLVVTWTWCWRPHAQPHASQPNQAVLTNCQTSSSPMMGTFPAGCMACCPVPHCIVRVAGESHALPSLTGRSELPKHTCNGRQRLLVRSPRSTAVSLPMRPLTVACMRRLHSVAQESGEFQWPASWQVVCRGCQAPRWMVVVVACTAEQRVT